MARIRPLLYTLVQNRHASIFLLLLLILILHLAIITQPPNPVFDERFYVPAARTILQGNGSDRIEHPPLAQLVITSGIWLFGDTPLGWRIFSVTSGIAGLFLFYLICRRLGLSHKYAFIGTFLLSFENLTFIQSSVAMLDVFSLTCMLASFWFFLKKAHTSAGISVGLAALSKLTGILALPVLFLYWAFTDRKQLRPIITTSIFAVLTFWALMPLLEFAIWHKWSNPFEQVMFMLQANIGSTFSRYPSDMLSRPWDWLLRPEILTYWIEPHYIAMISPPIWALIIPTFFYIIIKAFRKERAALFSLAWFTGTYVLWIPASLITDRISYIFYFYPSVGAICIGLSVITNKLDSITNHLKSKTYIRLASFIIPGYLLIVLGAFVILSPISYWWKVSICLAAYLLTRWQLRMEPQIEQEKSLLANERLHV